MTIKNQIIGSFAIILNNKNEILLGQRIEPDPTHPFHLKWGAPGGIVDFGENPEQTAIRETMEETGVSISLKSKYPCIRSEVDKDAKDVQIILLYYPAKYLSGSPSARNDKGTSEVKWFKIDEIYKETSIVSRELIEEAIGLIR